MCNLVDLVLNICKRLVRALLLEITPGLNLTPSKIPSMT